MSGKPSPVRMFVGGLICCGLSAADVPWSVGGAAGMPLRLLPEWPPLPIGMLVLFSGVALALRYAHRTSRIILPIVTVSAVFTVVYAVVLMLRYDYVSSTFGGYSNLVVEFPGLGGPLAILGALLGAVAAFGASRTIKPRSRPDHASVKPRSCRAAQQVGGVRG